MKESYATRVLSLFVTFFTNVDLRTCYKASKLSDEGIVVIHRLLFDFDFMIIKI